MPQRVDLRWLQWSGYKAPPPFAHSRRKGFDRRPIRARLFECLGRGGQSERGYSPRLVAHSLMNCGLEISTFQAPMSPVTVKFNSNWAVDSTCNWIISNLIEFKNDWLHFWRYLWPLFHRDELLDWFDWMLLLWKSNSLSWFISADMVTWRGTSLDAH